MKRLFVVGIGLALACGEGSGPSAVPRVVVQPLLDSLFVDDVRAPRTATYLNARGEAQPTGPVRWASSDSNIARVDSVTGEIVGRGAGAAVVSVRANGVTGTALLVVMPPLSLTLLVDTIYLMIGDTLTVPAQVRVKNGAAVPVTFSAPTNGVFSIGANGLITAIGSGGPLPFSAQAGTATASGTVEVVQLSDTTGGKGYFTIFGTVIRRDKSGARAVNYRRQGDVETFRVSLPILSQGVAVENMLITLPDPVSTPALFDVDSLSPDEAFGTGADPICRPPRPWALWSLQLNPPLRALSRRGGSLSITQAVPIANGHAISGRFTIMAQRSDLYDDPLAVLPIRGTFVAPLIDDPSRPCR